MLVLFKQKTLLSSPRSAPQPQSALDRGHLPPCPFLSDDLSQVCGAILHDDVDVLFATVNYPVVIAYNEWMTKLTEDIYLLPPMSDAKQSERQMRNEQWSLKITYPSI